MRKQSHRGRPNPTCMGIQRVHDLDIAVHARQQHHQSCAAAHKYMVGLGHVGQARQLGVSQIAAEEPVGLEVVDVQGLVVRAADEYAAGSVEGEGCDPRDVRWGGGG